ncbi:tRNA preQ1(34) S-adenosylmethionine ribosyltransferase-isomerase QueA [Candidatus Woesebacteria bacterium RIFCSPHIGHO2_01_FULL_41_10]|uniref:S-adenosylmethionine:tRNA ribosyltransferase-isomerase n=1 Tax=Candidatus Woesebacteria bacterium RIFCSPHIGHO2_01_FULL_41_10 TaxID=1802500 RepID=A0A1F7YUB1_9BACT|nr:MAG: tRNA preQ1(34) S-adenosylmethionine ribosyltransferase-isomerase QueA [Candidatus Woesebacteria bacterium RIFCSPHIGHO2_01_FULL_41_10]
MKRSQLFYELPKERIAHSPLNPRGSSKLLIINRKSRNLLDKHFYDLPSFVTSDDVLVLNNTKVFPARLFGIDANKKPVELLLLNPTGKKSEWIAIGKNIPQVNKNIYIENVKARIISKAGRTATLLFDCSNEVFKQLLSQYGHTPIPPYIHSDSSERSLREKYQTTYAKRTGSVAAPTAGLHFTDNLLSKLIEKGVQIEEITLHVGMGTFLPIQSENLKEHKMHNERFTLSKITAQNLNNAKQNGKRIISVGTTTTRVLEACSKNGVLTSQSGETDIFIYPPYKFDFVDALITNFHLPGSTLLALVSALASSPNTNDVFFDFETSLMGKAYSHAIENNYRFYSFGDACFIE